MGSIVALHRNKTHGFSKQKVDEVELVAGVGVAGDAHTQPIGYGAIYDANFRSGFAYVMLCAPSVSLTAQALAVDGAIALMRVAFREWPFRRIYFERPGFLPKPKSLLRYAQHEACFADRLYRDGIYFDLDVFSITGPALEAAAQRRQPKGEGRVD